MEFSTTQIAFISMLFAAGGALWGLFKVATSAKEIARDMVDAARKELHAELDKQITVAASDRKALQNQLQAQIDRLSEDLERLRRDTVRRDEMSAIETRVTAAVSKIEAKVDMLSERFAALGAIEKQMAAVERRLEAILARLDGAKAAAGD